MNMHLCHSGFGQSYDAQVNDTTEFLKELMDHLISEIKILVAPSMSG